MNEEIEYAEMLEIPVSTVNVVKKQPRRKKSYPAPTTEREEFSPQAPTPAPLKDSVIAQVNDKLSEPTLPDSSEPSQITAEADLFAESVNSEGRLDFDPIPERIDTVPLYSTEEKRNFWERHRLHPQTSDFEIKYEDDEGRYALNEETSKAVRVALRAEFIAACALCGAIFLTNIFMPNSAVNTFFRGMTTDSKDANAKHYKDFTLSSVLSDTDAEMTLSPTGILTFTENGCVYPVADGTVSEVSRATDGTYLVKISHSDSFTGVIGGLDYVYYAVGDSVKGNVPIGYSNGDKQVQVTMYSQGELLNCFYVTDENSLAWTSEN